MDKPLGDGRGPFGKFYFIDFLVAESNRVAFETSGHVVDSPGKVCNPLSIVNEFSGNGATHLTVAIGNVIAGRSQDAMVWMLSAEAFTSAFRFYFTKGMLQQFRDRFLNSDALLIDGLGYFSHNSEESIELTSITAELINKERQVVFNGCAAMMIPNCLQSIVNAGAIRQISKPEIELRREKVIQLAACDRINISADAIDLVAATCTRSIREVQGAYLRSRAIAAQKGLAFVCIDCVHEALSLSMS